MDKKDKYNFWKNIVANKWIRNLLLFLILIIVVAMGIRIFLYNDEEKITDEYLGTTFV